MERITEVRIGRDANAVLRLVRDAHRFRLERGAIRVGDGRAALPDTPGLIVHASVPEFDVGPWRALLEDIEALDKPGADGARFDRVREISIDTGSLIALGEAYPDTRVHATRGAEGRLAGEPCGPPSGRRGTSPARSERRTRVHGLRAIRGGTGYPPMPPIPVTNRPASIPAPCRPFRSRPGTSCSATTISDASASPWHPPSTDWTIERAEVRADTFEGEATGHWRVAGTEHVTDLVMRMYRIDLGRTLESLGFEGNAVAEGSTDISLRGSWRGTPADFALERLTGIMHFRSADGRLSQFERGVTGRVLGLLTITSLPRRLILDFGDLFEDGFGYDRIDGRFAIENGNAYTDDLYMESDTARLEVVGRTGLVSKDYDQLVTVIPKISSSLPLVPIWIAQKLLDRNVFDKAFAYQYTITGPWEEPAVELVKTEPRKSPDTE